MALYPIILRAFRSKKLLKSRGEKWRQKAYVAPFRFHRTAARNITSLENSQRAVKAVLILSYEPRAQGQIYESDGLVKEKDHDSFFDIILTVGRIFVIGSVVTGLAIAYFVTRFTHGHVFPIILRKSIEFLGPIFIKFGQWASTRKDLFPAEICRTLSQLQRAAPPHSWIYTKQLLGAVYGENWRNVFVKFEHEVPIGSGCCAQVYKAWMDLNARVEVTRKPRVPVFVQSKLLKKTMLYPLRDLARVRFSIKSHYSCRVLAARLSDWFIRRRKLISGNTRPCDVDEMEYDNVYNGRQLQPVAVKILHPGIKEQLRRDLAIMRGICQCATYVVPQLEWLSLTDCIDEFSQIMENQVDLNLEAGNLIQFSKNFSERKDVVFPRPYTSFSQCEVLVESFHEGTPISDYLDYHDTKLQGKLARIGIKTILQMVFRDNFIHCDLHPGNILVQRSDESSRSRSAWFWKFIDRNCLPERPRLVILDCGLVVSMNNRCRQNLRDVFRSVLMGNGELAAEYILAHSSRVSPDPDGFKSTLKDIVDSHLRSRGNVNVSTVVSELFSAMVRHRVKQDGSFSSVILSMVVIEGLGRSLDPNIDIFTEVVPFVFSSIGTMDDD